MNFYGKINGKWVSGWHNELKAMGINDYIRNDYLTNKQAKEIKADLEESTGLPHLLCVSGHGLNVIPVPKVGDEVSYGFNGDYYPAGKIVSVSKTAKKIVTDTGMVFYRRKQTACWLRNGMWSMVAGVVNERNPHF